MPGAGLWAGQMSEMLNQQDPSGNAEKIRDLGMDYRIVNSQVSLLALEPEVILLDEPTSGLDPISTGKVEESLQDLKKDYTIILIPHSVQQAARTADQAAFLLQGELVEVASGEVMFTNPQDQRTKDYIQGRFG